jgi:hypothetical protein
VNKDVMLELIHSELNAQYDNKTIADYALLGVLSTLVDDNRLKEYVSMRGWDK